MGKEAKLKIISGEKENPGLLIQYHDPEPGFEIGLLAMLLLFGLFLTVICLYVMYVGVPINWVPAIVAVSGVVIAFGAFKKIQKHRKEGIDIRYRVLVENGVAAFSFDGNVTYLDVSKIGRMWIYS